MTVFKKKPKVLLIILIGVIAAVGIYFIYSHFFLQKNMHEGMRTDMGITEEVSKQNLEQTVTASGNVLLEDEIEVYAEGETNKIKSILVEDGDVVEKGQLLVEYDVDDQKEELENKIRDTKREIQNGELSLKSISTPATESELTKLANEITTKENALQEAKTNYNSFSTKLAQQQTTIDNAQKDVDNANKDLEDNKKLLEVGGVSQSEIDDYEYALKKAEDALIQAKDDYNDIVDSQKMAELNVKSAENAVTEAKDSYNDAKEPLASEANKIKYQQQQLTLQGLKDSLADYEKDLSELVYSTSAAVSGKVTEVCVDEGTFTEENTVILKVANFNQLIVSANVEEYDAPLLELGQKVKMTSDGLEGKEYSGVITKISPSAADTTTNMGTETTVPIEISVDNPDGVLKPGYNLDLEITVTEEDDLLMISSSAVFKEDKENYVYRITDDDKIEKVKVTTGEANDTLIEIASGLSEGDIIIKSVNDNIKEGMTLEEVTALISEERDNSQNTNNAEGGNNNDRNNQFNQGVPSGNFGGGGPGGGGPMGR